MSGYLAGKVWQSDLDGTLKSLTACLADIASDDGSHIYPSIAYIVWLTGTKERAIQYQLKKLLKQGVLVLVKKTARSGEPNEYRLIESALPTRPKWAGAKSAPVPKLTGAKTDSTGAKTDISPYSDPLVRSVSGHTPPTQPPKLPPRPADSDDEFDDKSKKFRIEELEVAGDWTESVRIVPTGVKFEQVYRQWWLNRVAKGGITRRAGGKATLRQYAADLENYCLTWKTNDKNRNPTANQEYRGPGRNTEAPEAKKIRESCLDCNGTNSRRFQIDGKWYSEPCKHKNLNKETQ